MSRSFQSVSIAEFRRFVSSFKFNRRISEVHLHHTWRPTQSDYNGHKTIMGMWRHHTQENGWSDIGQHVTVAPDGTIWLCRNFNWAPASAVGFNGNEECGPFMIELIGDFDRGRDQMSPDQTQATLAVIKCIQETAQLKAQALKFHNEMSHKSCPGTTFSKDELIDDIKRYQLTNGAARSGQDSPFPESSSRVGELLRTMDPDAGQTDDMSQAEHNVGFETQARFTGEARGENALNDTVLDALTEHAIVLDDGQFSKSKMLDTSKGDVDRIFDVLLVDEIKNARADNRKARLLFYAHGGLVSEKNALKIAAKHLTFWRANNVYPIFFIWKTGFAETLGNLLIKADDKVGGPGTRGVVGDLTDNIIEALARSLGADTLWSGMKSNAANASAEGGGAAYVASKTAKLVKKYGDHLEIHTIGHSAGSIFHAHYMDVLISHGVAVETAQFLAPAINTKLFNQLVVPKLGNEIGRLTVFTMNKRREKNDNVIGLYRKSLLYLIYEALERKTPTDILGLEVSLRDSKKLSQLFGLRGKASKVAEIVWSPSDNENFGSASNSTSHGGFDDDPQTMQSALRRILGSQSGEPIHAFSAVSALSKGADSYWTDQFEWPERLEYLQSWPALPQHTVALAPVVASSTQTASSTSSAGQRKALCIGINAYQRKPLSGCVEDARLWKRTLETLGYQVTPMEDSQATAKDILDAIQALISQSRSGDNLVLQFSGHGTQFEDTNGDEAGGDTPIFDECLCAFDCDFSTGGLIIDDELRLLIEQLPDGVSMSCFFDCCHSGTATRAAVRSARASGTANISTSRYLSPSPEMEAAYRRQLASLSAFKSRALVAQKDVLFSACLSSELAWESQGQGDFTREATAAINQEVSGISNTDFLERVLQRFGTQSRQTPGLYTDARFRAQRFLNL